MVKQTIKVYLDEKEINQLKLKAEQMGLSVGRAWLSRFLEVIAVEQIIFIDENVRRILRLLDLK